MQDALRRERGNANARKRQDDGAKNVDTAVNEADSYILIGNEVHETVRN